MNRRHFEQEKPKTITITPNYRESHFVFPGKQECKFYFPGIPGIPGIDLYLIKLQKGHFLRNKMQY
jgi:hypothetical protein